jgi:hypothetical protein
MNKIYIESCPLIDMAEYETTNVKDDRANDVWFCKQALAAARAGKIVLFTSMLSIAECTTIKDGLPSPPDDVRIFYDMLLTSGKSGIAIVSLRQAIAVRARALRWLSGINLKGADTVHVATAIEMKCDELWTRDGRIWKARDKIKQFSLDVVRPSGTKLLPEEYKQPDLPQQPAKLNPPVPD